MYCLFLFIFVWFSLPCEMYCEWLVVPYIPFDAFKWAKFVVQSSWDVYRAFLLHISNPRRAHRRWLDFRLAWLSKTKISTVKVHVQFSFSVARRSLYCLAHHGIIFDRQVTHVVKILDGPFHLFLFLLQFLFLNKITLLRLVRDGTVLLNETHDDCLAVVGVLSILLFHFFVSALFWFFSFVYTR